MNVYLYYIVSAYIINGIYRKTEQRRVNMLNAPQPNGLLPYYFYE